MKAIFRDIQADLSCTPQSSFVNSSNSQSVMPGCILPGVFRVTIKVVFIDGSSMLLMTRMAPLRFGQTRGYGSNLSNEGHLPLLSANCRF